MKKSLMLHYDFDETISLLTNEEAGILLKSIYDYELRGEKAVFDDRLLQVVYLRVISCLDRNRIKYEKTTEKRRAAALKRWENQENTVVED